MFYLLHSVYPYISCPSSWIDLIKLIEGCRHELRVWKLNWERPPPNTFQLNTDGSALSNPGKIGGGGILRDSQGDMIYAHTNSLGTGTNNLAEVQAAAHGLYWCTQHDTKEIILEVDSEQLTKWISHSSQPPWKLQEQIKDIHRLIKAT
ncbi:hypothetical protein KY290_017211 [Solanum tuberosum]|uniref:RNase H type-1 domain-containing protein n=1 Tax=Solanum tuberosum TaxID=4113 RepID=A0ABQ7VCR5_SOLTU|nr:hypothetical protein KY290_017211 [Solanum tuberosum]